jgi:HEAT repeat protein
VTALGNSGDPGAIEALVQALGDASAVVRATAAWALTEVSPRHAGEILPGLREREHDPLVLRELSGLL